MNLTADYPWVLFLLLLLPVLWGLSYRSLAGLGGLRRWMALLFRTLVFCLLVAALARVQWRQSTDTLTVLYLLDQSESIPAADREFMLDYVHEAVETHRRENREDLAGVIIFGANAKIEAAPFEGDLPLIDQLEAGFDLQTDSTSLASALKLAKASFPEDTARRVVIVSDGNENLGDALAVASAMSEEGIGIDVLPVELPTRLGGLRRQGRDPPRHSQRRGLRNPNCAVQSNRGGRGQSGRRSARAVAADSKDGADEQLIAEEVVTLQPGKNIRGFKHRIDRSAVYTFDADFVPLDEERDQFGRTIRPLLFLMSGARGGCC